MKIPPLSGSTLKDYDAFDLKNDIEACEFACQLLVPTQLLLRKLHILGYVDKPNDNAVIRRSFYDDELISSLAKTFQVEMWIISKRLQDIEKELA